ncbi:MAG: winged helix-turn-helix transcriptional regulator [Hyphomicrobiaceae bacterium]|nr:winged helix-turn-helix transcriptional regulator [Hyphomicrobiaceae bacterium]
MLAALLEASPRIMSKDQLLARTYALNPNDEPEIKIIDVYVCKIRQKLTGLPLTIETMWGRGYRLVKGVSENA